MKDSLFSSFVMSETVCNQIRALPQKKQLKFFWAVVNFGMDNIEPDFAGMELAVWIPMRDFIKNRLNTDGLVLTRGDTNGAL